MIHRRRIALCAGIALLLLSANAGAEFQLELRADRDKVGVHETLNIQVVAHGTQLPDGEPPREAIENNFEVLSVGQATEMRIINRRRERRSAWTYTVRPVKSGTIVVPPLQWGKQLSNPLTIQVGDNSQEAKSPGHAGTQSTQTAASPPLPVVMLETEIDHETVPVRAQLIYTLRVLHHVDVTVNGKISQPAFPSNTLVYPLGQKRYQKSIQGEAYSVHEWRYAVFPQSSGVLNIPPSGLDGRLRAQRGNRRIAERSQSYRVTVLAIPASFRDDQWLAASKITLTEEWSDAPDLPLTVGKPITRKITMRAEGLAAEQLPGVAEIDSPIVKAYPEEAEINTEKKYSGLTGQRSEKVILIPTYPGEMILPAVELRWWDTRNGGLQTARLPERRLMIQAPALSSAQNNLRLSEDDDNTQTNTDAGLSSTLVQQERSPVTTGRPSWRWWLLTLLAGSAWPVLGWRLWSSRRRQLDQRAKMRDTQQQAARTRNKLLRQAMACARQNDPAAASDALLKWAGHCWPEDPPTNLPGIAQRANSPNLLNAVRQLNQVRYHQERKEWNGTLFAEAVQGLSQARAEKRDGKDKWNTLYP